VELEDNGGHPPQHDPAAQKVREMLSGLCLFVHPVQVVPGSSFHRQGDDLGYMIRMGGLDPVFELS